MEGSFAISKPTERADGSNQEPESGLLPKKGLNMSYAFNLYVSVVYPKVRAAYPSLSAKHVKKEVGRRWKRASSETKQRYADQVLAKREAEHSLKKSALRKPSLVARRSPSRFSQRSEPAATTKVAAPKSAKKVIPSDQTVSDSDSIDADEFGDATPFKKVVFYYKDPSQHQAELKDAKEKLEKAAASQAEAKDLKKQLATKTEQIAASEEKLMLKRQLCRKKDEELEGLRKKFAATDSHKLHTELKDVKGKLARAEASEAEVDVLKQQLATRTAQLAAVEKMKQSAESLGKECQAKDQEILRLGNEVTVLKRELLDCKAAAKQWEEAKQFFSKRQ